MYLFVKRVIDMIMSGLGLIILSPLLVIISVIIFIQMGRPVLLNKCCQGLMVSPFICDMSLIGSRHLLIQYLDYII